jgi:hypothetical protein
VREEGTVEAGGFEGGAGNAALGGPGLAHLEVGIRNRVEHDQGAQGEADGAGEEAEERGAGGYQEEGRDVQIAVFHAGQAGYREIREDGAGEGPQQELALPVALLLTAE